METLLALWTKLRGWAIGIGAVLLGVFMAIFLAFRKGSASATASIEATQTRAVNDALVKQTQIVEQVRGMPENAVTEKLKSDWSRDK